MAKKKVVNKNRGADSPPEVSPPTDLTPQALKDEHYAAIREAAREVDIAHAQYEEAKAESTEMRKTWEKKSAGMTRLI